MKILIHTIDSILYEQVRTEIRFLIASARAQGKDLISIKLKDKKEGKLDELIVKNLRAIKKEGKLDFFADKCAFESASAEASYLINKFPEVVSLIDEEDFFLLIKL